jgi:hypothetical protein
VVAIKIAVESWEIVKIFIPMLIFTFLLLGYIIYKWVHLPDKQERRRLHRREKHFRAKQEL